MRRSRLQGTPGARATRRSRAIMTDDEGENSPPSRPSAPGRGARAPRAKQHASAAEPIAAASPSPAALAASPPRSPLAPLASPPSATGAPQAPDPPRPALDGRVASNEVLWEVMTAWDAEWERRDAELLAMRPGDRRQAFAAVAEQTEARLGAPRSSTSTWETRIKRWAKDGDVPDRPTQAAREALRAKLDKEHEKREAKQKAAAEAEAKAEREAEAKARAEEALRAARGAQRVLGPFGAAASARPASTARKAAPAKAMYRIEVMGGPHGKLETKAGQLTSMSATRKKELCWRGLHIGIPNIYYSGHVYLVTSVLLKRRRPPRVVPKLGKFAFQI
jgi:hypothetical protein